MKIIRSEVNRFDCFTQRSLYSSIRLPKITPKYLKMLKCDASSISILLLEVLLVCSISMQGGSLKYLVHIKIILGVHGGKHLKWPSEFCKSFLLVTLHALLYLIMVTYFL